MAVKWTPEPPRSGRCTRCGKTKPAPDEIGVRSRELQSGDRVWGTKAWCKSCAKVKEEERRRAKGMQPRAEAEGKRLAAASAARVSLTGPRMPVGPVREVVLKALVQQPITMGGLAAELGIRKKDPKVRSGWVGDGLSLERRLGMKPWVKDERESWAAEIDEALALKVIRAIGYDPVDVGL